MTIASPELDPLRRLNFATRLDWQSEHERALAIRKQENAAMRRAARKAKSDELNET